MTIDALAPWYAWTKALHLISVFAWMAGLFYLPRLYVYHTQAAVGSEPSELFKTMERRLLRGIMNPAMVAERIRCRKVGPAMRRPRWSGKCESEASRRRPRAGSNWRAQTRAARRTSTRPCSAGSPPVIASCVMGGRWPG